MVFHGLPKRLQATLRLLPDLEGRPIRVRLLPQLRAHRGKLFSRGETGEPVHAGTFLRKREMVLEHDLLHRPADLARIFVHEVFHFAWLRLGNARRLAYEAVLAGEARRGASGELGWSAESRKQRLRPADRRMRTRRWREYSCESFCDSAAWLYAGIRMHPEFTLADRFRVERRRWFERHVAASRVSI